MNTVECLLTFVEGAVLQNPLVPVSQHPGSLATGLLRQLDKPVLYMQKEQCSLW